MVQQTSVSSEQQASLNTRSYRRNPARKKGFKTSAKKQLDAMKQLAKIDAEEYKRAGIELTEIVWPSASDVIFGRGGGSNNHPGNKRFRILVDENKGIYQGLPQAQRCQKQIISWDIVRQIRYGQTPLGRFLEQDDETMLWRDVMDDLAKKKTSQALREDEKPKSKVEKTGIRKNAKRVEKGGGITGSDMIRVAKKQKSKCSISIDDYFPSPLESLKASPIRAPSFDEIVNARGGKGDATAEAKFGEGEEVKHEFREHSLMDGTEDVSKPTVIVPIGPDIFDAHWIPQVFPHSAALNGYATESTNEPGTRLEHEDAHASVSVAAVSLPKEHCETTNRQSKEENPFVMKSAIFTEKMTQKLNQEKTQHDNFFPPRSTSTLGGTQEREESADSSLFWTRNEVQRRSITDEVNETNFALLESLDCQTEGCGSPRFELLPTKKCQAANCCAHIDDLEGFFEFSDDALFKLLLDDDVSRVKEYSNPRHARQISFDSVKKSFWECRIDVARENKK